MFEILSHNTAAVGDVVFTTGPGVVVFDEFEPYTGLNNCGSCAPQGNRTRGLQLTFANELTLSIMWGTRNYCDASTDPFTEVSGTAEIALCSSNDVIGDPVGWMTADQVLALIPHIVGLPVDAPGVSLPGNLLALTV